MMFGLKEAQIADRIRAVTSCDPDRDEIEERFARTAWSSIAEPGDRVSHELIQQLGAPRALAALVERRSAHDIAAGLGELSSVTQHHIQLGLDRWQPRLASARVLLALEQAARFAVRLCIPGDELWIPGVDDLGEHAPIALWLRGTDAAIIALERSVALVGARAATGYGEHVTTEISAGLVDRGFAIVSGAAYGIDGVAHRAALASNGHTVAFLAGGADRFYPSGHETLLNRIVDSGCVISELPCGSQPTKWRFLQRNRLIAAVCQVTVVLEAGWRSGSLNTAGHAAALGRQVAAVPGPVTSPASVGCHRVIREFQATLVTTAEEVAELAPGADVGSIRESSGSHDPQRVRVLDALSERSSRSHHELAVLSGLSVADVRSTLGILELESLVTETEHGWLRQSR